MSALSVRRPPTQAALSAFPSFAYSRMSHSLACFCAGCPPSLTRCPLPVYSSLMPRQIIHLRGTFSHSQREALCSGLKAAAPTAASSSGGLEMAVSELAAMRVLCPELCDLKCFKETSPPPPGNAGMPAGKLSSHLLAGWLFRVSLGLCPARVWTEQGF